MYDNFKENQRYFGTAIAIAIGAAQVAARDARYEANAAKEYPAQAWLHAKEAAKAAALCESARERVEVLIDLDDVGENNAYTVVCADARAAQRAARLAARLAAEQQDREIQRAVYELVRELRGEAD